MEFSYEITHNGGVKRTDFKACCGFSEKLADCHNVVLLRDIGKDVELSLFLGNEYVPINHCPSCGTVTTLVERRVQK